MHVSQSLAEWRQRRRTISSGTVGFVPTMGALHRGHASLVERCRRENDVVAVSIFVNPFQFNDPTDLVRYPRTLEQDLALLERLGTDEVLFPSERELYPCGFRFRLEAESLTGSMEGRLRPGFLQGVMTIVLKLLHLVDADRAYFGEKDYQQLRVISEMVSEFFIPTEIVGCPTVRESSGLAESSRNLLLSPAERAHAAKLFHTLATARTAGEARGTLETAGFQVEYVEEHWERRLAAVWLGGIRLIDNVPLARYQGDVPASLP